MMTAPLMHPIRSISRQRVLHLPYNQGNFIACIRQAEDELGADNHLLAYSNPFADPPDTVLSNSLVQRLRAFWALRKYDVAVFNYGASLFDPPYRKHFLLDLPLFPRRLKTAMIFQGSDIRTRYPKAIAQSRAYEIASGAMLSKQTNDGFIPEEEIERKRARAVKIDAHIDRLFYFNPDLAYSLPGRAKFLRYPYQMLDANPVVNDVSVSVDRPLRVLHLSTNRVLKGTGLIERAFGVAQARVSAKTPIQTKVLVRVPRAEALAALEWADIVVDQLGLGWYGMQALEALARGKPVLCNINAADWEKHMPNTELSQTGFVHVTSDTLADEMAELAENTVRLKKLSVSGPNFVRYAHDAKTIIADAYGDWLKG